MLFCKAGCQFPQHHQVNIVQVNIGSYSDLASKVKNNNIKKKEKTGLDPEILRNHYYNWYSNSNPFGFLKSFLSFTTTSIKLNAMHRI